MCACSRRGFNEALVQCIQAALDNLEVQYSCYKTICCIQSEAADRQTDRQTDLPHLSVLHSTKCIAHLHDSQERNSISECMAQLLVESVRFYPRVG